jgi:hypothetical protein
MMMEEVRKLAVESLRAEEKLKKKKTEVLYNVEYGASNRELEQFSDSYVYKIFLNEISKYTMNQPMSQDLFETLRAEDIAHIKAYGRATFKRLRKLKVLVDLQPQEDLL